MQYKINVLPSKSKRMEGKLIVTLSDGSSANHPIVKSGDMIFDVPNSYEWEHANSGSDGKTFSIQVEYSNLKGKTESYRPVPEKA